MRFVAKVLRTPTDPKVLHYLGAPPGIGLDTGGRVQMDPADILLIEERPDGVFLYRFTVDGKFCGDTWNTSIDYAKEQADFEFDQLLPEWIEVPANVSDAIRFAPAH
jgi:hypothetical protein